MATTTNYGFEIPDDTDLVKDGALAMRTLGQEIDTRVKALNPETTTGDIAYRSATANTNTRLAIGTAGQVLTVNSGATAPEWTSPGSTATNYTLINAGGTALTGAATITVGSISNKNELAIEIVGASSNTINSTFTVRFNTDSGSNYDFVHHSFNTGPGTSFGSASQSQTSFVLTYMDNTADTFNAHLRLSGANAAGIKPYSGMSFGSQSGTTNRNVQGHYLGTSTISSISVISSAGNFDAGTIFVYGA
jgi:hypothetical protein